MRRAIEAVVALKRTLPADVSPAGFLRAVLPFWNDDSNGDPVLRHIDPGHVLGASFQGWPSPDDPAALMDALNGEAEQWRDTGVRGYHAAEYLQVGDMDFYVAHEGKNRVDLFAAHRRAIAAVVTPTPYPAPGALQLVECRPWGAWGVTSTATPDVVHPLPYPETMRPLLLAYGVRIGRPRWRWFAPIRTTRRRHEAISQRLRP